MPCSARRSRVAGEQSIPFEGPQTIRALTYLPFVLDHDSRTRASNRCQR